MIDKLPFGL